MNTVVPSTSVSVDTHVFPALALADRSDTSASGAVQGLVRVVKGSQDLLFDKHNFEKYEATLISQGWAVYEDIRDTLNVTPAPPVDDE